MPASDSDDDISFADALGLAPAPVETGNRSVFKQRTEWIVVAPVESDGKVMIEELQDRMLKKYYVPDLEPLKYVSRLHPFRSLLTSNADPVF
jgi:hypothetical protein